MRRAAPLLLLFATACGGGSTTAADSTASTSGDESAVTADTSSSHGSTVRTGPAVIAVPLTGVPRDQLRPELQELFVRVETAAAITPPNVPEAVDEASLTAFFDGPFRAWTTSRVQATRNAADYAGSLGGLGPIDRAFAAALVGYAFEDMAASARGMPLPATLEGDAELRRIFQETVDRALLPIAEYAATAYDGCSRLFTEANDPAWAEWPAFCQGHLDDLREVFGRYTR